VEGILAEASAQTADRVDYDLIAIGASEEWFLKNQLFGSIPDRIADGAPCSVLMVRKHEPSAVSWLRRKLKHQRGQF
jgi:nucleotide-binding universal stress UspA family protein